MRTPKKMKHNIELLLNSLDCIKYDPDTYSAEKKAYEMLKHQKIGMLHKKKKKGLASIEKRLARVAKPVFNHLSPGQIVHLSRYYPGRPRAYDYIDNIFKGFAENLDSDHNSTIIGGRAKLQGMDVIVLGVQKDIKKRQFGIPYAKDYMKAMEIMDHAERYSLPLVSFVDTPGAYPDEEHVQGWAISQSIYRMVNLKVPTVAVFIGEGGSGGALALSAADHKIMLENSYFSSISPEGGRAIWKNLKGTPQERFEQICQKLDLSANHNLKRLVIDEIIEEPLLGAHADGEKIFRAVGDDINSYLKGQTKTFKPAQALESRIQRALYSAQYKIVKTNDTLLEHLSHDKETFTELVRRHTEDALKALTKEEPCGNPRQTETQCGEHSRLELFRDNLGVCKDCGYHYRVPGQISAPFYLSLLVDRKWSLFRGGKIAFDEFNHEYTAVDLTGDRDAARKLADYQKSSGSASALITGSAKIGGHDCILALSNFGYSGGTLGGAEGKKFVLAAEEAIRREIPFVSLCQSGGVRIDEGTSGLMQMVSTIGAVSKLKNSGIPYITILTNPTTGGVLGSYAFLGDTIFAERDAQVSFAGIDVIKSTTGKDMDSTFIDAQSVAGRYHGDISVVSRHDLKKALVFELIQYSRR
jgi:acetyl-CoA carboxylase carboxyl transferase subunit alpha